MAVLATYPGSYTVFGDDEVDNINNVFAIHINKVRAEILALQRTLGIRPQGDYATVVARLDDMDQGVVHIARVEHITGPKTIDVCAIYNLVIPAPVALGTGLGQASFQIGLLTGPNLGFGVNQIECRNNNVTAPLTLNRNGGTVTTGGALQVGNSGTAALNAGTATVTLARVNSTGEASLGSTTHGLQVGVTSSPHTIIDGNELMSRGAGGAVSSDLFLQDQGGHVNIGGTVSGKLRINSHQGAGDFTLFGTDSHGLQIGRRGERFVAIDDNEIYAMGPDQKPSMLYLNFQGGNSYGSGNVNLGGVAETMTVGNLHGIGSYHVKGNGVAIQFYDGGSGTNEVRASDRTFAHMVNFRAASYLASSSESVKTDIEELPFSALDVVDAAPALMFRYVAEQADPDTVHIGPMAESLPSELVHNAETEPAVSLMSMIGTLWAAVTELSAKVNVLADTVDRLAGP